MLPSFAPEEWKQLSVLCKILKPIKDATIQIQKRSVSIAFVIPLFKTIEMDLVKHPQTKDLPVFQKAIVDGITSRLNGIFTFAFIFKT
jgi:hypothetical protein